MSSNKSISAPAINNQEFDTYAAEYDQALAQGLTISGEDKDYFAQGRVLWLRDCLAQQGVEAHRVLDFGCGT